MKPFVAVIGIVLAGCFCLSCDESGHEGFAIYFPAGDVSASDLQKADLRKLSLNPSPFLSEKDIVSYDPEEYAMELTEEAFHRFKELRPPVSGMPFVVCVDGQPIYPGAFWTSLSSNEYSGIVIWTNPIFRENRKINTIYFETGYPAPQFFSGKDLRNDERIINSLKKSGKLKSKSE
jgi:hypothetical protein